LFDWEQGNITTIDQVWAGRTYISQRTSPEVAISGLLRVLAMTKSKKGSGRPKGLPYFGFAEAAKAGGNVAGFNQAAFYPGPEVAEDREAAIQKYVEVRARAARGGKANVGDKAKKRKILADVLAETPGIKMQMKLLERELNRRLAEAGFKTVGERTIRTG
jgi:hypothetical protein